MVVKKIEGKEGNGEQKKGRPLAQRRREALPVKPLG
jgi:hypothetical protein